MPRNFSQERRVTSMSRPASSGRCATRTAGCRLRPRSAVAHRGWFRVYALATVKRGTSHEEVADLVEGFFTASSTDSHSREIIIADYDEEPEMLESDIRQG